MARPNKTGLDYFPLDVDFFADEKIAAISGEFGIKGEITVIKLLCAVYRNGYFILWNEPMKYKMLRDLPGIGVELLDQIVTRLVLWGFFDQSLFDSVRVLTSRDIQKRFFYITKRRVVTSEMPYLLVSVCNNGVSAYRNPRKGELMYTEIPKVKQSKGNNTSTSTPNVVEDTVCSVVDSDISLVEDQNAGARKEPEVETAKEVTWRDSFDVYLMDLRAAWKELVGDPHWMADRQRFNPGVDIKLTLEKACKEFWATEAGWKHKKKSKSRTINWKLTLETAVSLKSNRVYDRQDNTSVRNRIGVSDEFMRQVDAILDGSSSTVLPQNDDPYRMR